VVTIRKRISKILSLNKMYCLLLFIQSSIQFPNPITAEQMAPNMLANIMIQGLTGQTTPQMLFLSTVPTQNSVVIPLGPNNAQAAQAAAAKEGQAAGNAQGGNGQAAAAAKEGQAAGNAQGGNGQAAAAAKEGQAAAAAKEGQAAGNAQGGNGQAAAKEGQAAAKEGQAAAAAKEGQAAGNAQGGNGQAAAAAKEGQAAGNAQGGNGQAAGEKAA
jgi:hypothetical protein